MHAQRSTVLFLSMCSMCCGFSVTAQDWTQFQSPVAAQVDASRLPMKWSAAKNVAWTADIAGYGQSSPVTFGERVFVTSISGPKKERCHVAAFDLKSGKTLWQHDLDAATQTENSNYVSKAAPTPVVDAAGVVCFFEGGNLLSLTHEGQVRWQRNLVTEFGAIESRHGLAASLEQTADRVFVWVERSKEPYVLAVDKTTGKDVWKAAGLGVTSWSSPRLVPVQSGQHLVLSGSGAIVGLDPATGKQHWKFEGIKGNSTPTPAPIGNGRFLMGASVGRGEGDAGKAAESNGLIAIKQTADGSFQADFVWKSKRATSSFGSPIAHQGHAYFVNATGVLYCLDLETGEERFANRIGDSIWATPIPVGDRLYFFGKSGVVSIVASGPKFESLAENATWEAAAQEKPAAPATPTTPAREGGAPSAGGAGRGGPSFGGPVLYAAVFANNRLLLLRRGDKLFCIVLKS